MQISSSMARASQKPVAAKPAAEEQAKSQGEGSSLVDGVRDFYRKQQDLLNGYYASYEPMENII